MYSKRKYRLFDVLDFPPLLVSHFHSLLYPFIKTGSELSYVRHAMSQALRGKGQPYYAVYRKDFPQVFNAGDPI